MRRIPKYCLVTRTHERIMCLVKLYEKKSVLWNPSNPEYFHRDIRNMVYDDLVRELNIPELTG